MVEKTLSASEHTKQQLASALKVLMAERPMDKITISDFDSHLQNTPSKLLLSF